MFVTSISFQFFYQAKCEVFQSGQYFSTKFIVFWFHRLIKAIFAFTLINLYVTKIIFSTIDFILPKCQTYFR